MTNIKANVLSIEQFHEIVETMRKGGPDFEPNKRNELIVILLTMTGLRLGDILKLKLNDFWNENDHYFISYVARKTSRGAGSYISKEMYQIVREYAEENSIQQDELLFPITERTFQKYLKKVTRFLELEGIGTRSFCQFYLFSMEKMLKEIKNSGKCSRGKSGCANLSRTSCLECEYYITD